MNAFMGFLKPLGFIWFIEGILASRMPLISYVKLTKALNMMLHAHLKREKMGIRYLVAFLVLGLLLYSTQVFAAGTGNVSSFQKISDIEGGFTGELNDSDLFGRSIASLGDLDGDGITDIVVGAQLDDDGGSGVTQRGAVWVLFLNSSGGVKSFQKISDTEGSFTGTLEDND